MDVVLGQNLGQTKLNVVKKSKETGILSIGFFHILHGGYLLKEKVVIVQTPGWKCKVNISRNATFEGCQGQMFVKKWQKTDYFQELHLS